MHVKNSDCVHCTFLSWTNVWTACQLETIGPTPVDVGIWKPSDGLPSLPLQKQHVSSCAVFGMNAEHLVKQMQGVGKKTRDMDGLQKPPKILLCAAMSRRVSTEETSHWRANHDWFVLNHSNCFQGHCLEASGKQHVFVSPLIVSSQMSGARKTLHPISVVCWLFCHWWTHQCAGVHSALHAQRVCDHVCSHCGFVVGVDKKLWMDLCCFRIVVLSQTQRMCFLLRMFWLHWQHCLTKCCHRGCLQIGSLERELHQGIGLQNVCHVNWIFRRLWRVFWLHQMPLQQDIKDLTSFDFLLLSKTHHVFSFLAHNNAAENVCNLTKKIQIHGVAQILNWQEKIVGCTVVAEQCQHKEVNSVLWCFPTDTFSARVPVVRCCNYPTTER